MTSAKCLGHRLCIRQWPIWSQFCSIGLIAVRYTRTCPATPTTFWAMTISAIFQHAAVFYFIELTAIIGNGTNTCYDLLKWVYIVFRFLFCCSLLCRILCFFSCFSKRWISKRGGERGSSSCMVRFIIISYIELRKWSS